MLKYEKMLFEVLINYIPKISNSLDEISEELKELNYSNRVYPLIDLAAHRQIG